ncbi:MAG: lytic transglycosylase domain-containing protein [Saprospiraceae bacterium]
MRNALKFILFFVAISGTILLFTATDENDPGLQISPRNFIIPTVDPTMDYWFANERVPVENFDVRERLEREFIVNTYRHSNTILNIKKSRRFFAVIEPILKEYGIPEDFKYTAVAESDFRNATSPAGARGVWQLMEGTALDYGLEVNDYVDERLHLEKATRVACEHLKDYYSKFGSWTLAAAAYNMGASALSKELERQGAESYYDLNLSEETNRYILRLVAIKYVLMYPGHFGFEIEEEETYPPLDNYAVVEVDTTISNLGDFARQFGVSYRMLKIYNPWLRSYTLPNKSGKQYEIKIPK